MSNLLAGIVFPSNGVEVFTEDWQNEQSERSAELINRDLDSFGSGIVSGGEVTLGSGNYKVNISSLVAYDEYGKRIEMPSQTDHILTNGAGILAVRHAFDETSVVNPGGTSSITYRANTFELFFRTLGLQAGDVALWDITVSSGVVTLNSDERVWRKVSVEKGEIDLKIPKTDIEDSLTSSSTTKVLSAKQGNLLKVVWGRQIGEVFPVYGNLKSPSATFPAICISASDQTLLNTNWADLVPALYGYQLKYDELGTPQTQFTISTWSSTSDVVTITFANNTPEKTILRRLHQDAYVHGNITTVGEADADFDNWYSVKTSGSLTNFRTITLVNALRRSSDDAEIVPIGTYTITDIVAGNSGAGQIKFTHSGSGSTTGKSESRLCEFYPHRITGSTTSVRWFKVSGRTLYSADGGIEYAGGLRKRNTMQGVRYNIYTNEATPRSIYNNIGGSNYRLNLDASDGGSNQLTTYTPTSDGINGTPRVASKTAADSVGVYMYLFGGSYTA